VTVLRKELFKSAQTKPQFIIVAVSPFHVAKLGKAKVAISFELICILIALGTPLAIVAIDP
jgi:uncharacterized membrane protein